MLLHYLRVSWRVSDCASLSATIFVHRSACQTACLSLFWSLGLFLSALSNWCTAGIPYQEEPLVGASVWTTLTLGFRVVVGPDILHNSHCTSHLTSRQSAPRPRSVAVQFHSLPLPSSMFWRMLLFLFLPLASSPLHHHNHNHHNPTTSITISMIFTAVSISIGTAPCK